MGGLEVVGESCLDWYGGIGKIVSFGLSLYRWSGEPFLKDLYRNEKQMQRIIHYIKYLFDLIIETISSWTTSLLLRLLLVYWLIKLNFLLLGNCSGWSCTLGLFLLLLRLLFFLIAWRYQVISYYIKKILNVSTCLCWNLNIGVCLLFWYLLGHFSYLRLNLLLKITLVPNNVNFNIISPCFSDEINPFVKIICWAHC